MVTPISGSPVVFGLFHTPHCRLDAHPARPAARARGATRPRGHLCGWAAASDRTAGEQAGEPAAAQSGETGLPPGAPQELETAARRAFESLRQRDQEVRLHEQAHLLAAGPYAKGAPSYTYQTGPDGQRYAVGGEVPIDLSPVPGNPQATLQKALTIRRAALAPTDPSEDRSGCCGQGNYAGSAGAAGTSAGPERLTNRASCLWP